MDAYRRSQRHTHLVDHFPDNLHALSHVAALRAQVRLSSPYLTSLSPLSNLFLTSL